MSRADGNFQIDEIEYGEYYLHFDFPGELGFTTPNVGDDETMDSDVDHSNGPCITQFLDVSADSEGYGFTAGVGAFVRAVTWATIAAENDGVYNTVEWSTASEDDLAYFVVERSLGATNNFEAMPKMESLGSVNQGSVYSFDDYGLANSDVMYYRVQSVDREGTASYSKIVVIELDSKNVHAERSVYPNPSSDFVHVKIDGADIDAKLTTVIYNEVGEKLLEVDRSYDPSQSFRINLDDILSGTYTVQTTINNKRFSNKIVVVK